MCTYLSLYPIVHTFIISTTASRNTTKMLLKCYNKRTNMHTYIYIYIYISYIMIYMMIYILREWKKIVFYFEMLRECF